MKKNLWSNKHGTITIMVSMMLIPAILLSGTAVDLARIHTAKSIAHNANQLASNAVLTQYNALLKDLYGLFGVAQDDPELVNMIDEYIQVAVFGEGSEHWIDNGLGTLQLFNGSTASAVMTKSDGYDLGDAGVLRRQIEEYMKFRGPVILVSRLLDALDVSGPSIKPSKEALDQQEVFSEGMLELFKMFNDLYNKIVEADKCEQVIQLNAIKPISDRFDEIKGVFDKMKTRHATWDSVKGHFDDIKEDLEEEEKKDEPDELVIEKLQNILERYEDELTDIENDYNLKRKRIEALTNGGDWYGWNKGYEYNLDDDGRVLKFTDNSTGKVRWVPGEENESGARGLQSLQDLIDIGKIAADAFKPTFQSVVDAATNIDNKRTEVYRELETLQQKIDAPNCDETLSDNIQAQIDICRELLDTFPNIKTMAENYKEEGEKYLDDTIKQELMDEIIEDGYRERTDAENTKIPISTLGSIATNDEYKISSEKNANTCAAATCAAYNDVTYKAEGFTKFRNIGNNHRGRSCIRTYRDADGTERTVPDCDNSGGNCAFYDTLEAMANGSNDFEAKPIDGLTDNSNSDDPGEKQKSVLTQLKNLADTAKDSLISNPEGAREIHDTDTTETGFGTPDVSLLIDFVTDPGYAIQNLVGQALLLTYATSMFSSYTTGKPKNLVDEGSVSKPDSLAGIPMNPKVNYFYQSEWEYLLVGHQNAIDNLDAVKNSIYAIRLVCNAIAVFAVDDVKRLANTIKSALTPIPYVGPALGIVMYFLTFATFAAAESAYDMVYLRNGCKVPLVKDEDSWKLRIKGICNELKKLADGEISHSYEEHEEESGGVSYEQYLLIFLLITTNVDALVTRMSKLIEWNTNNYLFKVNVNNMKPQPNEKFVNTESAKAAMTTALNNLTAIRLKKMNTDFNITTTINLRLYFLTMPMFQRQGANFERTFPVKATDYRGY